MDDGVLLRSFSSVANYSRIIMGFFTFVFGGIITILIFLVAIGVLAVILFFTFKTFIATFTDSSSSRDARSRGLEEGRNKINSMVATGIRDDSNADVWSGNPPTSGGKCATRSSGPTSLGVTRFPMGLSLLFILALSTPALSSRIHFGEINGRFRCDSSIRCGRDNSFHEMHLRIEPPLNQVAAIAETPWLFAPWDSEDTISSPITCDPKRSGQCYVLNQGTLRVEVEASRPYWRYDLSRYPVYEFPSSYKINTTIVEEPLNFTGYPTECDSLLFEPSLFGDNGPCWQHVCGNGSNTVVTETVGIAPGCGSFLFHHPYPRLTMSLRVRIFDITTLRLEEVVLTDVYDGASSVNAFGSLHVEVHNMNIPGGKSWQPAIPMRGNLVVCDWRRSWASSNLSGLPSKSFLDQGWYYAPPAVLQSQYAHRGCGMNGVALHHVTKQWTGRNCSDSISFADGECLPATTPLDILTGNVAATAFTPPYWDALTNNTFIHQNSRGDKIMLRPVELGDLPPGYLFYDVVLRVSNSIAMTDAEREKLPFNALCIEYDTLECIVDPVSLTVRMEGKLGNRAWEVVAANTTVDLLCTYDDGARVSNVTLTDSFFINAIEQGGSASFYTLFDIPEEGIHYRNGAPTPRLADGSQYQCSVVASSAWRNVNTTFRWNGAVNCSELIRKVYSFTDDLCPCHRTSLSDIICRFEWDCTNEGGDLIYFIVLGIMLLFDIGGVIGIVIYIRRTNSEIKASGIEERSEGKVANTPEYETNAVPSDNLSVQRDFPETASEEGREATMDLDNVD